MSGDRPVGSSADAAAENVPNMNEESETPAWSENQSCQEEPVDVPQQHLLDQTSVSDAAQVADSATRAESHSPAAHLQQTTSKTVGEEMGSTTPQGAGDSVISSDSGASGGIGDAASGAPSVVGDDVHLDVAGAVTGAGSGSVDVSGKDEMTTCAAMEDESADSGKDMPPPALVVEQNKHSPQLSASETDVQASSGIVTSESECHAAEAARAALTTDVTMATVNPAPAAPLPATGDSSSVSTGRQVAASGALAMLAGYSSDGGDESDAEDTGKLPAA